MSTINHLLYTFPSCIIVNAMQLVKNGLPKMKKLFCYCVFFLGFNFCLNAQSTLPLPLDSGQWIDKSVFFHMDMGVHVTGRIYCNFYKATGTTKMISGKSYRIVGCGQITDQDNYSLSDTIYARTEGKKVYFKFKTNPLPNHKNEYLVYDFSLNKGDTGYVELPTTIYNDDDLPMGTYRYVVVDKIIDSVTLKSKLKIKWVKNYPFGKRIGSSNMAEDFYFIEGVGSNYGFVYWKTRKYNYKTETVFEDHRDLVLFHPVQKSFDYTCNPGNVNVDEHHAPDLKLYPNPAKEYLIIESEKLLSGVLELYSLNGQMISSTLISSTQMRISLNDFSKGIYFYQIKTDDGIIDSGKLILN